LNPDRTVLKTAALMAAVVAIRGALQIAFSRLLT
jgi:hypothetical protein